MSVARVRSTMRSWAVIDALITLPLLLPASAQGYIELVYSAQGWFILRMPVHPGELQPLLLMFAAVTGALGLLWALARWYVPEPRLGWLDTSARVWIGGLLAGFIIAGEVPVSLWAFVALEWLGAIHQAVILGLMATATSRTRS